ncbi:MAG TPA: hypothetical protein VFO22_10020 [Candidatus Udaeobacter sp.]|nr:hypothetical protein [Candidatus Udaeobacter sp.]
MKTKTALVTLAFSLFAAAVCFGANPQMGTWKLNEKKSKLGNGMAKNSTVVYQSMVFKTKVTIDGTDPDGKPMHSEWSGKFDGKDYAVKGDPTSDMRSYRKVDDRTLEFTVKHHGKVVASGRIVVAPDGKSRTVNANGTDPHGKKFKTVAVYDKA